MTNRIKIPLQAAIGVLLFGTALAYPAAIIPGTLSGTLGPTDDGSSAAVSLNIDQGSGIDFLGTTTSSIFVNNNGNVTFGSAFGGFIPNGLAAGVGVPIIAPFFADVDTTGPGSGVATYGNLTVGGRNAFLVNWLNVGYYPAQADKTNSFQLALIDRSDTGAGNFDIEFNYGRIHWETGNLDGGTDGLGGISAAVGYSNGQSGANNVFYQLPGSLVNGALIDGGPDALVSNSLGDSGIAGRYDFEVRGGQVIVPTAVPEPGSGLLTGLILLGGLLIIHNRRRAIIVLLIPSSVNSDCGAESSD